MNPRYSTHFSILVLGSLIAYAYAGFSGLLSCLSLSLLELSLSFENALLNANQLKLLPPIWQRRFLTWGLLLAVLGMRLGLPIALIASLSALSPKYVIHLILYEPLVYREHLQLAKPLMNCFGGLFLAQVCLHFLLREKISTEPRAKPLIHPLLITTLGCLGGFMGLIYCLPPPLQTKCSIAGLCALGLFQVIQSFSSLAHRTGTSNVRSQYANFAAFCYLELLDMIFSLDGVIAAFAMSNDVVIILLGLGIGAYAVRAATLHLLETGSLVRYPHLARGAHLSIGLLAVVMFINLFHELPGFLVAGATLSIMLLHLRPETGNEDKAKALNRCGTKQKE